VSGLNFSELGNAAGSDDDLADPMVLNKLIAKTRTTGNRTGVLKNALSTILNSKPGGKVATIHLCSWLMHTVLAAQLHLGC
jgi:hypothetical protein